MRSSINILHATLGGLAPVAKCQTLKTHMGLENGTVQLVETMDRFHAIEAFLGFRYT